MEPKMTEQRAQVLDRIEWREGFEVARIFYSSRDRANDERFQELRDKFKTAFLDLREYTDSTKS